ncbi:carbohydrate-binding module family 50 protein [Hypoxylon trugodes]|uniref:carbohydrate-binding module family 50 protein n=1 Tax=Hypoxylon trugodes TaxID=326681 RepID=UPI00219214D2|nr:carbohydrate-binding module family 50 protein [Hypoxylon trugodes]KAI1390553.1 carbohydrate-binding module family 50 protein [Hypoxylon trugodes]
MDPRFANREYGDERQYGGEANSYYRDQNNPQGSYSGGGERQQGCGQEYGQGYNQGYGQPNNPQYGNNYGPPSGERYGENRQYNQNDGPYQSGPNQGPNQGPGGEDGDRGLMGGLAGAAVGAYGGHKMGHGIIGGLAGAFAGHKLEDYVHDRKDKKEEEERYEHQHSGPPPGYSSGHHHEHHHHSEHRDRSLGGDYAGNFSSSSYDIHLEGDYDLRATCKDRDGEGRVSILNLDNVLSNEDGRFRWSRGNSGPNTITVQQGDTLRDIARRFNCSYEDIARRNDIPNADMIYPGQVLQVPGQSSGGFSASARDIRLIDGGRVLEAELRDIRGDWHRSRIELDERIGNDGGNLRFV